MARSDAAVSPVIGVLLMLTLTLVIAAVVSSYAGGLMNTDTKSPSVTLQVTYSISGGLEIRDINGDPIPTSSVSLIIRPSETMGRIAGQQISTVDKQYITDYLGRSWTNGLTVMKPGDLHHVTHDNLSYLQKGITDSGFWINQTQNEGKSFFLEMYHKNTMISRNEVLIQE